eukprot:gnl/MRDRNA2_/MRDRNA2_95911_c0_seq1.p1 gnl/MRDRNA2_/MRDRNA2_95911_c0~~gnl/MRDRNA2_/MRDRNA2_95911_c0_seq1.p1  ORF type:complete len:947 (-),score=243.73 gnl/MRDRNA2_/MRDRNA2_95911_c0_seq1:10-2490(-)
MASALQLRRQAEVCNQGCWSFCNQQLEAMAEQLLQMQHQNLLIEAAVQERTAELIQTKQDLISENSRIQAELQAKIVNLEADLTFAKKVLGRAERQTWRLLYAQWSEDQILIQELSCRALVIQKFARGLLGRLRAKRWFAVRSEAALMIQRVRRGQVCRIEVDELRSLLTRIAIALQRRVRGWQTRRRVRALRDQHRLQISTFVVPIIRMRLRQDEYDIVMVMWNANAVVIQRLWRGVQGRARALAKRQKREAERAAKRKYDDEQQRIAAEKKRLADAEAARKKRDAQFQAELKKRQEEQKQKEAARLQEMKEQRAAEELRRKREAEERKNKEKEEQEAEQRRKTEWRKSMADKLAAEAHEAREREIARKTVAAQAVEAKAQAMELEKQMKLKEEKRKKQEEKKKQQQKAQSKEDKRKRAMDLNRAWTNNEEEIQSMREFLLEKYHGPKGTFRIMDIRLDPATLFEEKELEDFLYCAGYCLQPRAKKLFKALDTNMQGVLSPEDVVGQVRPDRKIQPRLQRTWSATSLEIEELAQMEPEIRLAGPEGAEYQLVEWIIPAADRFMKPGLRLRCATFEAFGASGLELEFRPMEEKGISFCSLLCRGELGMHFRLAFFVGRAQSFPEDKCVKDEEGSRDWWGVESFCDAKAHSTNDGDLHVGLLLLDNLALFDNSVQVEEPLFASEAGTVTLRWRIRFVKLLRLQYPRGWPIKSPEFSALGFKGLCLEFFPTGSFDCQKARCSSLHLHAPIGVYVQISFYAETDKSGNHKGPELEEFRFEGQPAKATELFLYEQVLEEGEDEVVVGAQIRMCADRRKEREAQLKNFGVL